MLCSLGTALLDEFRWLDDGLESSRPCEVRFGGGGTYAAIGARVWSRDVGLLVDRGPDFPPAVQRQLDSFGPMWYYTDTPTPTPRALNVFRPPSSTREFSYLAPHPARHLSDLAMITSPDKLSYLHLCCPPSSLAVLLPSLARLSPAPQLIYEPIPFACNPAQLPQLVALLPHVRVFSPNDDEAAALLGVHGPASASGASIEVEELAQRFRDLGARDVVVRAGERGAFVLPEMALEGSWVPAFHSSADEVKDTVGAGNAFLGGLMAALALSHGVAHAARYGAVSAGIVVESVGLPVHTTSEREGEELWNGRSARARLEEMDRKKER
ncbi:hypothetical protein JCM9279_003667 [Rhodotorula babjevae]